MNEGIQQALIRELAVNVLKKRLQPNRFSAGHDALDIVLVFAGKVVGGFESLYGADYDWRVLLWVGVGDASAGGFVFELEGGHLVVLIIKVGLKQILYRSDLDNDSRSG
jgi:hypothetical protein